MDLGEWLTLAVAVGTWGLVIAFDSPVYIGASLVRARSLGDG